MKNIKLSLTPFESKSLKYLLDLEYMIPKAGPCQAAVTKIKKKLAVELNRKKLI